MATALTRLGYRCVHEGVFNPQTLASGAWRRKLARGACGSSWLALSVLDEIPRSVAVVALTRHPLDVIRSLRGIRFFAEPNEYTEIARSMFDLPLEPIEAAAWFWIEANRRALAHANVVTRIESPNLRAVVDAIDPRNVVTDARLTEASRRAPLNGRSRDESVTLDMLEPGTRNALREVAAMAGYEA